MTVLSSEGFTISPAVLAGIGITSLVLGAVILRFPPSHLPDRKVLIRGFGLIVVGAVLTIVAAFRAGG